jgi:acyl-CoA thioester hydrolase
MHETRIEIRWRDMDAFGHVNNSVYLTYLEDARDRWLEAVLGDGGSLWDFVLAHVGIDFRSELRQSDRAVVVRTRLARVGNSSIGTREEIFKEDGTLAAEAEAVLVARDLDEGRSRPLTAEERTAFERALEADTAA